MEDNRSFFLCQFRYKVQLHVPGPRPAFGSDQCHSPITVAHKSVADLQSNFLDAPPPWSNWLYLHEVLAKFGQIIGWCLPLSNLGLTPHVCEILDPPPQMLGNQGELSWIQVQLYSHI